MVYCFCHTLRPGYPAGSHNFSASTFTLQLKKSPHHPLQHYLAAGLQASLHFRRPYVLENCFGPRSSVTLGPLHSSRCQSMPFCVTSSHHGPRRTRSSHWARWAPRGARSHRAAWRARMRVTSDMRSQAFRLWAGAPRKGASQARGPRSLGEQWQDSGAGKRFVLDPAWGGALSGPLLEVDGGMKGLAGGSRGLPPIRAAGTCSVVAGRGSSFGSSHPAPRCSCGPAAAVDLLLVQNVPQDGFVFLLEASGLTTESWQGRRVAAAVEILDFSPARWKHLGPEAWGRCVPLKVSVDGSCRAALARRGPLHDSLAPPLHLCPSNGKAPENFVSY